MLANPDCMVRLCGLVLQSRANGVDKLYWKFFAGFKIVYYQERASLLILCDFGQELSCISNYTWTW